MKKVIDKIVVTGGAGFIGSVLVPELLKKGYQVTVLDNLSVGKKLNLRNIQEHPRFQFLKGDITSSKSIRVALQKADAVVHLAAQIEVAASVKDPLFTHKTNVTGTLNLLHEASNRNIEKFVLASSAAVYGDTSCLPIKEETLPKPISPYAASKAAAEAYLSTYAYCYGLHTVALRFFNVYGQKNNNSPYSGVITKFLQIAERNQSLLIDGDGVQSRDFIHVDDVVRGIILVLETEQNPGEVFNLCTGKPTSINELAAIINKITGKSLTINHGPPRIGDIKQNYGDPTKASEKLGFKAQFDLAAGLKKMLSF